MRLQGEDGRLHAPFQLLSPAAQKAEEVWLRPTRLLASSDKGLDEAGLSRGCQGDPEKGLANQRRAQATMTLK
jgi:hypothetical protein